MERAEEGSFPYWVALIEERCTGANHEKIREFCRVNGLTLSRFDPGADSTSPLISGTFISGSTAYG
jgi:hypothetical protein